MKRVIQENDDVRRELIGIQNWHQELLERVPVP